MRGRASNRTPDQLTETTAGKTSLSDPPPILPEQPKREEGSTGEFVADVLEFAFDVLTSWDWWT